MKTIFLPRSKQMAAIWFAAILFFGLISIELNAQTVCNGQPPLAHTISSANPVCPGQPFILSLSGLTHQPGYSYEWIKSTNGTGWIPFATTNSPVLQPVTQLGNTFYACKVTCNGSQLTTGAIPVQVGMVQAIAQYPLQEVTVQPGESTQPSNTGEVAYSSPCCTTSHVSFSDVIEATCCKNIITRTWTIVECGGSSYTYIQIITQLLDILPPVIMCAPLAPLCNATPTPSPTTVSVTDQCPTELTVVTSSGPGDKPCETIFTFVWTATDQCGNRASCTQTASVIIDEIPPNIICPEHTILACNTVPTPSLARISATDNCGTPTIELTSTSESNVIDCIKWYFFHWKATDACGNSSTCVESFEVRIDTEKPKFANCPENITVPNGPGLCGAVVTWAAPTATDNCDLFPDVSQNRFSGGFFDVGETTVIYVARDKCMNEATCTFKIKVNDTEAPNPHCPGVIFVDNDLGFCDAWVNYALPATDNCGIFSIDYDPPLPAILAVGLHEITATVLDIHGNMAVCTFKIRVRDTEKPLINNMPANIVVDTDPGFCDAFVFWNAPNATDNCGIESFVRVPAGNLFPKGVTFVDYTATDIYGNVTTKTFTVTVKDNEPPAIMICPGDIDVDNDPNQCRARVSWVEPTATDNCGVVSFTRSHDPGDYFPVGVTTVKYRAKDAAGNETVCSFDIDVNDNEKPRIIQPDIITCDSVVIYAPLFVDNCSILESDVVPPSGSVFPVGTTLVLAEAFDIHGNYKAIHFSVTRLARPQQQDSLVAESKKICLGDTVKLSVVGGRKGEGGHYAYYRVKGSLETYIDTGTYASFIPADTGSHTFVARVEATCDSTEFDTVKVYVIPPLHIPPDGPKIWGERYPCRPSVQGYKTHKFSGVSYVWSTNSGITILNGQGTDSITVSIPSGLVLGKIGVQIANDCRQHETYFEVLSVLPAPAISPSTGSYADPQWVTLSSDGGGHSLIYYTTSGNIPVVGTSFTKLYSGPFQVLQSTTVRSIQISSCLPPSPVAVSFITISNPGIVATPNISPGTGSYPSPQLVSLTSSTSGALIYYTLTGNVPVVGTSFTKLYSAPIAISATTTIKAIAIKAGLLNSAMATAILTIPTLLNVATPVFTPPAGTYAGSVVISIACATPGATIYLTTNGITPSNTTPAARLYTGPFSLSRGIVLKAIAYKDGFLPSSIAVGTYSILPGRQAMDSVESENKDFANSLSLTVYPNPTSGIFKIKTGNASKDARLFLLNMLGQNVWTGSISDAETEVNIENLPAGIFTLVYSDAIQRKEVRITKR